MSVPQNGICNKMSPAMGVTNIKRNYCRLFHSGISISKKKSDDANYSALIWLPLYNKSTAQNVKTCRFLEYLKKH